MGQASGSNSYIGAFWLTVPRVFFRRVPVILGAFAGNVTTVINTFHEGVATQARKFGTSEAGLSRLQHQLGVRTGVTEDHAAAAKDKINLTQKDINRSFVPVVRKALAYAYVGCAEQHGNEHRRTLFFSEILPLTPDRYWMFYENEGSHV